MSDAMKIGSALAGGYLLGRTKKAKTAIGLAMWLTGRGRPRDWLREGALRLAQTPEVQDLVKQARGPLLESARGAATSTFHAQLGSFADDLNRRTGVLTGELEPIEQDEADDEQDGEQDGESADERTEGPGRSAPRSRSSSSRSPAKRSSARKPTGSTGERSGAKRSTAKRSAANRSSAKRSSAKRSSAERAPAKKTSGRSSSTRTRQASSRRSSR